MISENVSRIEELEAPGGTTKGVGNLIDKEGV
jgi:hypothetical protein